jgi:hypothetical protein
VQAQSGFVRKKSKEKRKNRMPGPLQNAAALIALWPTVKTAMNQVITDANTLAADYAALEASLDQVYGYGAGDLVDWVRRQVVQGRLGYAPRISAGGNTAPLLLAMWAPQPGTRDLSNVDQRPVATVSLTAQQLGLS